MLPNRCHKGHQALENPVIPGFFRPLELFSSNQESPSCPPENRPSGTRKNQASFPFHSGNPTTFSSIFNFQFSASMTSASVSASKPLLPLFHSAIRSKPYKPSLFPVFPVFFGIGEGAWEGLGMGCLWRWQRQKKKQDQTNFFEIHLTLLHVFYVLFHSDTWMSLGGTRTCGLFSSHQESPFCPSKN